MQLPLMPEYVKPDFAASPGIAFMSASFRLIHTTVFCLLLLCSVVDESAAQSFPDSLVSVWLKRGAVTNWSPSRLYLGCPKLEAWQRRGIDLLFAAPLSAERTRDFAIAMTGALRCNDPRLNQWYFDRIDAAMDRSTDPASALVFWNALEEADSPGIRTFLRSILLDATKPESYRSLAGGKLFGKYGREERLREYLALFERRQMPWEVAVGINWLILQSDSENLFRSVAARVREQPELADQLAFAGLVENAHRHASADARLQLSEALEAALKRPGLAADLQTKLRSMAIYLREPPK